MQTKKSPQDQNQYVPLNDHINNTHGRKVPSRHQRHNSSSAAMESPRHHQYPYASTELQQQQQQQQASYTPPPPPQSKQVYQYDAPWPLYALDWCKTPGEQRGHRLAIGSIIEETNNKVCIQSNVKMGGRQLTRYTDPSNCKNGHVGRINVSS